MSPANFSTDDLRRRDSRDQPAATGCPACDDLASRAFSIGIVDIDVVTHTH